MRATKAVKVKTVKKAKRGRPASVKKKPVAVKKAVKKTVKKPVKKTVAKKKPVAKKKVVKRKSKK